MSNGNSIVDTLSSHLSSDGAEKWVVNMVNQHLREHLQDIKDRADADGRTVSEERNRLQQMSPQARQEMFHTTAGQIIASLAYLRITPSRGARELKKMIRDPTTLAALELIFDREAVFPDRSEEEFPEIQQDTLRAYIHWAGVAVAPEMYDRETVEETLEQISDIPDEVLDTWDDYHRP